MFKVLQTSGKIKVNPVDTLKQFKKINMPVEKEIKISLTMQDVKTAIKKEQGMTIPDKKMILIIRALVKTGLRISELLHIKNKDIEKAYDLLNSKIRIVGKGRKERFIFLDNKFLKDIEKIWPKTKETDYLLYTRNDDCYDRRNVGIELTAFFKRKINKHVHPHSLRHVFATHKINVEKQDIHAVSRYLGHASVSTTLSAYIDTALDIKTSRIKI
jgi:integrase/recombinase XerD